MIGGGGGGGSISRIAEATTKTAEAAPAPKVKDKEVQQVAAEALRRRQMQKGYRRTILSTAFMDNPDEKRQTFGT